MGVPADHCDNAVDENSQQDKPEETIAEDHHQATSEDVVEAAESTLEGGDVQEKDDDSSKEEKKSDETHCTKLVSSIPEHNNRVLLRNEGFLGGNGHDMLGIPKERKKWTKPKPKDTTQSSSVSSDRMNNDWLGGGGSETTMTRRRFKVPKPSKSSPNDLGAMVRTRQKYIPTVPADHCDDEVDENSQQDKPEETTAEDHHQATSEDVVEAAESTLEGGDAQEKDDDSSKEEKKSDETHCTKLVSSIPEHNNRVLLRNEGFLGGNGHDMLGVPKERKKWTKPKPKGTTQSASVSSDRMNN